jgi:ubiquinone/menaquinone biosynthesis C-methylase UbiE
MRFGGKLMQLYFDSIYNPVYDFTTARLPLYQRLQRTCIDKLEFEDGDEVLCVGVGTGNEITLVLGMNSNVSIVGVDYSKMALQKAYRKALKLGKKIESLTMDVRRLEFEAGSFDKVLCLHVMDFIGGNEQATAEILRVLKNGGQFVITYPSDREGVKLGANLLKDSIRYNIDSRNRFRALLTLAAQMVVGAVYLPLLFRSKKRAYSRRQLEAMFTELTSGDFQIEEYPMYQDFIVYGIK